MTTSRKVKTLTIVSNAWHAALWAALLAAVIACAVSAGGCGPIDGRASVALDSAEVVAVVEGDRLETSTRIATTVFGMPVEAEVLAIFLDFGTDDGRQCLRVVVRVAGLPWRWETGEGCDD